MNKKIIAFVLATALLAGVIAPAVGAEEEVTIASLEERIAELVKDKKVEGISDLRDESNRNGMRIVIELKRDVNANIVLNNLYFY